MNQDQLAQLIRETKKGSRRLPSFSSGLPSDWQAWRIVFENHARAKSWDDAEGVTNLVCALEGQAARVVHHIDHNADNPKTGHPWTINDLLDKFGEHFLPAAMSHLAVSQFYSAKQGPCETLIGWHTRLRELFTRAFPAKAAEDAPDLIYRFVMGISHPQVRSYVYDAHETTYSKVLEKATTKTAGVVMMKEAGGKEAEGMMSITPDGALYSSPQEGERLGAFGSTENPVGKDGTVQRCHRCNSSSHFIRECPEARRDAFRGRGRGRTWRRDGRGPRGRGGRGGGRGASNSASGGARRQLGAIEKNSRSPATTKANQFSDATISAVASALSSVRLNSDSEESEN